MARVILPSSFSLQQSRSRLPVVELDRTVITRPRVHLKRTKVTPVNSATHCTLGPFCDQVDFSAYRFFHAAVKTSVTVPLPPRRLVPRVRSYMAMESDLFIWDRSNLRRTDRSLLDFEEFESATRAGRFAEAAAYLLMVKKGYIYWDRVSVLWARAMERQGLPHSEQVRRARAIRSRLKARSVGPEPDFAMENARGEVILMESKGSFVGPDQKSPTVKQDLAKGLKQLAEWDGLIRPRPTKSFAVGTYFRDQSDTRDPSLITFVDPPPVGDFQRDEVVDWPEDWIRRGNYAAWLASMGFVEASDTLASGGEYVGASRYLLLLEIRGRQYAVVPTSLLLDGAYGVPPPLLGGGVPLELAMWLRNPPGRVEMDFIGLELGVLRQLEAAVQAGLPVGRAALELGDQESGSLGDGVYGSVMPDGTVIGTWRQRAAPLGIEQVVL